MAKWFEGEDVRLNNKNISVSIFTAVLRQQMGMNNRTTTRDEKGFDFDFRSYFVQTLDTLTQRILLIVFEYLLSFHRVLSNGAYRHPNTHKSFDSNHLFTSAFYVLLGPKSLNGFCQIFEQFSICKIYCFSQVDIFCLKTLP